MVLKRELRRTAAHITQDLRLERIRRCADSGKTHHATILRGLCILGRKCTRHLVGAPLLYLLFETLRLRLLGIHSLLRLFCPCRLLRLDARSDAGADLLLPLAIECHLTLPALLLQHRPFRLPNSALTRELFLRHIGAVHRPLIVNLEVNVQNSVQIVVVNRLLTRLVVRLRLLAIELRQSLLFALKRNACRDHRLCIFLPDGVLKRCIIRLGRLNFGQLGEIAQEQRECLFLCAQFAQMCIGGMCRKNLRKTHRADLTLR